MYLKDLKNAVIFKFIHRKISSCLSTHLEGILDQERKWLCLNTDVYYFEMQNTYTGIPITIGSK